MPIASKASDAIKIDETGDHVVEQDDLLLGDAQLPGVGCQQMLVMAEVRMLLLGPQVEDVATPRRAGQHPSRFRFLATDIRHLVAGTR